MPRRIWQWMALVALCGGALALGRYSFGRFLLAWGASDVGARWVNNRLDQRHARRWGILLFLVWAFCSLSFMMLSAGLVFAVTWWTLGGPSR